MYNLEFKSLVQLLKALPDEKSCREHLEQIRWEGNPICPHCKKTKHYKLKVKREFNGLYKCAECSKKYTVKIGTIFESSPIPLRTWFIAIFIFTSHKRGISSYQLAEDLGVTQKTSWFMLSRLRSAFVQPVPEKSLSVATMDETFVGGKNKNRHKNKKVKNSQGRSFKDKTPVFGMIQSRRIYTRVIPNTQGETLKPLVKELVKEGATIVTDEWMGYTGLNSTYDHVYVNHNLKQYSTEQGLSSNNVENFWSHLKRSINGTYYQVSRKHLQKYCDEMSFRFNSREENAGQKFNHSLTLMAQTRLRYKDLISA